ncbi:conserved hypothetical protein [Vibrio crassostreae]|nr:conserved hypothetical protein [Vibrio crassostreae]CAK2083808.1 conserved hypothetical protein [Vibrio crassostreae]CAK2123711.1 conserved hypothetical protein [Vibrio crassostreae]CAK2129330.1 conserved hypothetical protein [Vibrio crassostreae]CAK2153157.1 conserved hypothetical protein [Vibrio crassostreae]
MTLIYKEMRRSENKITQIDINNINKNSGIWVFLLIRYKTGFTLNPFNFIRHYFYKTRFI